MPDAPPLQYIQSLYWSSGIACRNKVVINGGHKRDEELKVWNKSKMLGMSLRKYGMCSVLSHLLFTIWASKVLGFTNLVSESGGRKLKLVVNIEILEGGFSGGSPDAFLCRI